MNAVVMAPHSDAHGVMSLSACSGPRGLNRQILQESFTTIRMS